MKPSFMGQRSKPATDQKFHPTDEHLIEENKEEVDKAHYGDKTEPLSSQHHAKFDDIDKSSKNDE